MIDEELRISIDVDNTRWCWRKKRTRRRENNLSGTPLSREKKSGDYQAPFLQS
jgi:hypothetical protein